MPAGLVLKEIGATPGAGAAVLIALGVFLALLTLGLAYEWFYGNLDWIRPEEEVPVAAQALPRPDAEPPTDEPIVSEGMIPYRDSTPQ